MASDPWKPLAAASGFTFEKCTDSQKKNTRINIYALYSAEAAAQWWAGLQ